MTIQEKSLVRKNCSRLDSESRPENEQEAVLHGSYGNLGGFKQWKGGEVDVV